MAKESLALATGAMSKQAGRSRLSSMDITGPARCFRMSRSLYTISVVASIQDSKFRYYLCGRVEANRKFICHQAGLWDRSTLWSGLMD